MKFAIALLLAVFCAVGVQSGRIAQANKPLSAKSIKELKPILAEIIAKNFIESLTKQSRAPVLDPFEDPLQIPELLIDLTGQELDGVRGLITGDVNITGTSNLIDDLAIALTIPAKATYNIGAKGDLHATGTYDAHIELDSLTLPITGAGPLDAAITDLNLRAVVSIIVNLITNKFTVTKVEIDIAFATANVHLANFKVCDELVDWEDFNSRLHEAFDEFWGESKADVEDLVKQVLVELLKDCKITDLLIGNYDCLSSDPAAVRQLRSSKALFNAGLKAIIPTLPKAECAVEPVEP